MSNYASQLIAIASKEVGYHEKASNSNLDDKTANSGHANFTKYADLFDREYTSWYNGKKNGYDWCDVFVDWCFVNAFGYKNALSLTCQPEHSLGAGVGYSAGYYKAKGRFFTDGPQVGDQIFFGFSAGEWSHTGIVESVDGSTVHTIEGNVSDTVGRRTYSVKDARIIGYGRPAYDKEPEKAEDTTTATKVVTYTVKAGDTLSQIGGKYGVGYETIAEYNGLSDPNLILVGQVLKIPAGETASAPTYYTVKAGDTLSAIGKKYGKTVDELLKLNPDIVNRDLIFPGQKVRIS